MSRKEIIAMAIEVGFPPHIIAAQRMGAHSTQAQTAAYIRNKKAIKSTATH